MATISDIKAHEILDSRGNPTIAVEVFCTNGIKTKACVPSGASTGQHEAVELRDNDPKRYQGKGVLKACAHVEGPIRKLLLGKLVTKQAEIDGLMIEADHTENKAHLGANAILGVSLAVARAGALSSNLPLYAYLAGDSVKSLPCPMLNILNGGAHADNSLEFQEFMVRPHAAPSFHEALRAGAEIFHTLKTILKSKGYSTSVGDEGGFAPNLKSHEQALELISEAIQKAGYKVGSEISIAIDCAASEIYDPKTNTYFEKKKMEKGQGERFERRSASEQISYLETLVNNFAIDTIEDGLAENDWQGWQELTKRLGGKIQIVGDDIFVTNPKFLMRGIKEKIGNSILIKLNQIGTVTETIETIQLAHSHNFRTIISHRSGETEDTFIADFAVATNAGQIKTGAPSRGERVAKYNRLLEIENELYSTQAG